MHDRPLRVVHLTPGTGYFLCGSCLRDTTLCHELQRLGHHVTMVPLYLPFYLEEPDPDGCPVMLGGINLFLQQRGSWLGTLPRWVARVLDRPGLLRWASRRGDLTDVPQLAAMTLSMLKGEHGPLHREVERLAEFVASLERPDAIVLSNALILGVARRLKERTGVPVLCSLQGEAPFVRALPAGSREAVWELMRERARDADGFLAVSATYGREMQEVLGIPSELIHVVHNGIVLDAVGNDVPAHASRKPPTVGYLARLCDDKGLSTLVEAFVLLAESGRVPDVHLLAAGVLLDHDRPLVARLEGRLRAAGLAARARILPDVSRAEKWALLKQMTVFSVPATYGESFGLYLLEALAAGVPVVQPRHGAFPEILEATGGGLLCEPGDPRSLAAALEELLLDPDRGQRLAAQGRGAVARHFTAEHMARRAAAVIEQFTPAAASR